MIKLKEHCSWAEKKSVAFKKVCIRTKIVKGLVDALDIGEFKAKLVDLYGKWNCKKNLSSFKKYFSVIKKTRSVFM